ncbi:MAG: type II toxin-antitoxin system VapC family toxin [Fimbriimonas sp.]
MSLHGQRAYLDANTVIYALEGFPEFANLKSGLLEPLDAGAFTAVTSELTIVETVLGPRKSGNREAEGVFRTFLTPSSGLSVEPVTLAVLEKVIDIRTQFGLKIPDAIHIATGILTGCTLFVTRDLAWAKTGINVVDPSHIG